MSQGFMRKEALLASSMSTTLIEKTRKEEEMPTMLLPLCEANRQLVVKPELYASNAVFTVGALRLIDQAP